MSGSHYPLVRARFKEVDKPIACQISPESSPLIAIANYLTLALGKECKDFPPIVEESALTKPITDILEYVSYCIKHATRVFPPWLDIATVERLLLIVPSLSKGLHLSPGCQRCLNFRSCDAIKLFYALDIKVFHGWMVDPNDTELSTALGIRSRDSLLEVIRGPSGIHALVSGRSSNPSSLSKRIRRFAETGLTRYGLQKLHEEVKERDLAVLCIKDQFDVIYKCAGDLFVLETDVHVLEKSKEALWRKLTLKDEEMFYVTMHFDPAKGQQNIHKATEWLERKLTEVVDFGDKGKEKNMPPRMKEIEVPKLVTLSSGEIKKNEEAPEPETSGHDPSVPHASPPEKEDKDAKAPTTADRFLEFLSQYQGVKSANGFMLRVPFWDIHQYDGVLAIDILDDFPRMQNELRESFITHLVENGFDKEKAKENAQLEIIALPEPKSIQKFSNFVEDNEMVHSYELYNKTWDNVTTPVGRRMGLGYLNHMFDNFDIGKCWARGDNEWNETNMEVRNSGKEFIINKEADQEATKDLVFYSLMKWFLIICPRFQGKTVNRAPVFFDSLQADIIAVPDPKGDPRIWNRYSKMMRASLAFKAPLVRSGLVTNFYRVLSLQLSLEPSRFTPFIKTLGDDWRSCPRTKYPFLEVYRYRNDVSDNFRRDKLENSHWHVLKYARHSTEHILIYLKSNFLLHDIAIVEMMVSRCLERHIAKSIRFIVMEYGVDGLLSTAWGCFEDSECKPMPLQIRPQDSSIGVAKLGENEEDVISCEERFVILVSRNKDDEIMMYSEIGRPSKESHPVVRNLSLDRLKDFLVQKGFEIKLSSDGLQREEYILVAKIISPEERSNRDAPEVRVEGVLSEAYKNVLSNIGMWLSSSDNQ